jgi:hypothetical protein
MDTECVVCSHLKSNHGATNSHNEQPSQSLGGGLTPIQANWFLQQAYGMQEQPFQNKTQKSLCSTHYQHLQKRLPQNPLPHQAGTDAAGISEAFKERTGATWVGHMYRRCICCNAKPTEEQKNTPDYWFLTGPIGDHAHHKLTAYLQLVHPAVYAPAVHYDWDIDLESEDPLASTAHMAPEDIPVGKGEWLCAKCWQDINATAADAGEAGMDDALPFPDLLPDPAPVPAEQQHSTHSHEATDPSSRLPAAIQTAKADLATAEENLKGTSTQLSNAKDGADTTDLLATQQYQRIKRAEREAVLAWLQLIQERSAALLQDCTDRFEELLTDMVFKKELPASVIEDSHKWRSIRR